MTFSFLISISLSFWQQTIEVISIIIESAIYFFFFLGLHALHLSHFFYSGNRETESYCLTDVFLCRIFFKIYWSFGGLGVKAKAID
jgi:hypothetical protein